jgi:hypothetical protein
VNWGDYPVLVVGGEVLTRDVAVEGPYDQAKHLLYAAEVASTVIKGQGSWRTLGDLRPLTMRHPRGFEF